MQIYLQTLSTICYPVSRDQFVDLCPALSKFAHHGLDGSSKVNLFCLAFVQLGGRGVNPEGICLTIGKPTIVQGLTTDQCDHRQGSACHLKPPFSLTRQKCMNLNLKRPPELTITRLSCKHFIPTLPSMANISLGRISILFATDVQQICNIS